MYFCFLWYSLCLTSCLVLCDFGPMAGELTFKQAVTSLSTSCFVPLQAEVRLLCESSKWKQQFLLNNIEGDCCVYDDVVTLAYGDYEIVNPNSNKVTKKNVHCVRHNAACPLTEDEEVFILKSGFSCKSASRANQNQKANKQGIANEDWALSTVRTFKATALLVDRLRPLVLFLENVDGLSDEGSSGDSNLSVVLDELRKIGEKD